jgi:hypothetical protein
MFTAAPNQSVPRVTAGPVGMPIRTQRPLAARSEGTAQARAALCVRLPRR